MRQKESQLQQACKRWFDLRFPHLAPLLFAVPNGHYRHPFEARRLKCEGVVAGVSDMILLYHGALCIEFKTDEGRPSSAQKRWEAVVTTYGAEYVIIRDVDSFIATVEGYITRNYKKTKDGTQTNTAPAS